MSRVATPPQLQQTGTQAHQAGSQHQVSSDKIAMRAYEKWCKRGKPHGTDQQDWLDAERELREEAMRGTSASSTRR